MCVTLTVDMLDVHANFHPYHGTRAGRGGGGGFVATPPPGFAVLQYSGYILSLIYSLSCDLQDAVNIMGYGAAGGP